MPRAEKILNHLISLFLIYNLDQAKLCLDVCFFSRCIQEFVASKKLNCKQPSAVKHGQWASTVFDKNVTEWEHRLTSHWGEGLGWCPAVLWSKAKAWKESEELTSVSLGRSEELKGLESSTTLWEQTENTVLVFEQFNINKRLGH